MRTTREALVEAAAALLEEGGVPAVTLREVGRRSGVSHNAPYKHFADKEELLAAVAARELRRRMESTPDGGRRDPVGVLRARLHALVDDALAHPEVYRLTYGPPGRPDPRSWPRPPTRHVRRSSGRSRPRRPTRACPRAIRSASPRCSGP